MYYTVNTWSKVTKDKMARNDATYDNKRSKNLLKSKEFKTEEYKVVEVLKVP